MGRINCPKHNDTVASCYVYPNGAYCYAGCGMIPKRELAQLTGVPIEALKTGSHEVTREPEDLVKRHSYIASLPLQPHRGFRLPTDATGYYLLYPGSLYYLKRQFTQLPKYIGAAGHRRPLYVAHLGSLRRVLVVEGEFNAASIGCAIKDVTVISPGGAGNFESRDLLDMCTQFSEVTAVADADAAGISALMKFKAACIIRGLPVTTHIVERDANEIHQLLGLPAVKAEYEGILK